jgi:hypothetical protein
VDSPSLKPFFASSIAANWGALGRERRSLFRGSRTEGEFFTFCFLGTGKVHDFSFFRPNSDFPIYSFHKYQESTVDISAQNWNNLFGSRTAEGESCGNTRGFG